jgi:hypothetical protein
MVQEVSGVTPSTSMRPEWQLGRGYAQAGAVSYTLRKYETASQLMAARKGERP